MNGNMGGRGGQAFRNTNIYGGKTIQTNSQRQVVQESSINITKCKKFLEQWEHSKTKHRISDESSFQCDIGMASEVATLDLCMRVAIGIISIKYPFITPDQFFKILESYITKDFKLCNKNSYDLFLKFKMKTKPSSSTVTRIISLDGRARMSKNHRKLEGSYALSLQMLFNFPNGKTSLGAISSLRDKSVFGMILNAA